MLGTSKTVESMNNREVIFQETLFLECWTLRVRHDKGGHSHLVHDLRLSFWLREKKKCALCQKYRRQLTILQELGSVRVATSLGSEFAHSFSPSFSTVIDLEVMHF